MLPGCNNTSVSLGTRPHSKRMPVATSSPPDTLHQQPSPSHHDCSPHGEYDITGGMFSNTYNITAPKRHTHISPAVNVFAGVISDTSCPDSHHSSLSEQQHNMIKTTSDCLLDMITLDTGALSLGVKDTRSLAEQITRMYTLVTMDHAVSTRKRDTGSNWKYCLQWCAMHNTPPIRPYMDKRATVQEAATECYLWTVALPCKLMQPALVGVCRNLPQHSASYNISQL